MRHVSKRLLLSLVVWVTVLTFGHRPAEAQVLTKDNGHKLYAATEHFYAGTANIRFSELGELPGFEYPAGYEHIYVGAKIEGWSVSYRVGEEDRHYYTVFEESYGGINQVSYTVIQDDAEWLRIECETSTPDGVLDITHLLEMNKAESRVFIHMTVANVSNETVSDIRIKRVCDLDLDTGGEYGWAAFDDWFELAENGVRTYTTDPVEGREAHEMILYGIPAPTWFGADQWDDWYQRENTTGPDQGFAEADYPVFGDFTATLSWDLGNLSPSSSPDTVTAVYQMGVYETQKPNAEATDSSGNAKTQFNPTEDVYVKGSLFPPNSSVDVYVVSDRGWRGGENITGDVGDGMDTVSTDGEGNIGPFNVWAAPLVMGQYDIVLDANRDGIYNQVSDAVVGAGDTGFSVASTQVVLPDLVGATYPILGDVTLEVSGGATIWEAQRHNVESADNPEGVNFPIGAFDFLIEDVSGSATTLTITPPEELWEPSIGSSFVNANGSTKDVGWFVKLSPWAASGASLEVDREAKVIRVILEDGGPGDGDGQVNGQIAGPGAPGNEVFIFESPTQKGGTSQEDYRIVTVPLNAVPGTTLFEAIDSGVPAEWKYGADGDIRILFWNVETQEYEELSRPDSTLLFTSPPMSYDMAGVAFWRIARTNHSYEYTGTPLDPEKLPVDSSTEFPYFEIILQLGWNQFGFPFSEIDKVRVNDLLISDDQVSYIPVTDESNTVSQHTIWEFEDMDGDGSVNDVPGDGTVYDAAQTINKGHGYWLYVNAVPEPYTGVALRVLHAPADGMSNASAFSIMSVEAEAPPPDPPNVSLTVNTGGGSAGGGCFIATAAYGSILHPYVKVLREFRDAYLLTTEPGKRFVAFYYRHGPKAAQIIAAHAPLKLLTRVLLLPLIGYSAFMVYNGMIFKLFVMAALMLLAAWVIRRGLARRPL